MIIRPALCQSPVFSVYIQINIHLFIVFCLLLVESWRQQVQEGSTETFILASKTPHLPAGDPKAFPSNRGCIISPVICGFALTFPPGGTSPENLQRKTLKEHPNQTPDLFQHTPLMPKY